MPKDKNAPKRPLTGYFRFIASIREEAAKETGLKGIALTPHMSKRWNALSEAEKNTYISAARVEMDEWKKKMEIYRQTDSYRDFQKLKKKKKAMKGMKKPKDVNAPKRPPTGYFLFMTENRPNVVRQNPEAGIAQLGKIAGQKWREMSEEKKASYNNRAAKLKVAYQAELKAYRQSDKYREYEELLAEYQANLKDAKKAARKEAKKLAKANLKKKKSN
jgi:hypothetical protein